MSIVVYSLINFVFDIAPARPVLAVDFDLLLLLLTEFTIVTTITAIMVVYVTAIATVFVTVTTVFPALLLGICLPPLSRYPTASVRYIIL